MDQQRRNVGAQRSAAASDFSLKGRKQCSFVAAASVMTAFQAVGVDPITVQCLVSATLLKLQVILNEIDVLFCQLGPSQLCKSKLVVDLIIFNQITKKCILKPCQLAAVSLKSQQMF